MPDWISDPETRDYLALLVLVATASGLWLRTRRSLAGAAALAACGALSLLALGDVLFQSPREKAVRQVQAMAEALEAKDWVQFASGVSDRFEHRSLTKAGMKPWFDSAERFSPRITVWNFEREAVRQLPDGSVEITFDARAEVRDYPPLPKHFKAVFVRDPDQHYRLRSFRTYNIVNKSQEEPLPGE